MMRLMKCIGEIVGIVHIMISRVLSFSADAPGLKNMAKVRARKFLEVSLIKAASSLNREGSSEKGFI
jgi:hypothetical protein